MMQLDYPWRLNEMGAFIDRHSGELVLNRHLEEVGAWKGLSVAELRHRDVDLSRQLMHCRPYMDVGYVAAASLLIRADVARTTGIWRDFFIHFDDVEWCMRIAQSGQRIVVSARSLIWHLSAAAKVPTWVLYYDNRNILYLVQTHGVPEDVRTVRKRILLKALYYAVVGHTELANLHIAAIDDFAAGRAGKKDIQLNTRYRPNGQIAAVFDDQQIRRVLIPWTINMQATGIQEDFIRIQQKQSNIEIHFIMPPEGKPLWQLPNVHFVGLPRQRLKRIIRYLAMRGHYDLVLQSDYQKLPLLSLLGARILFVNDEGFFLRPPLTVKEIWETVKQVMSRWLG
jgi:hypothetical protein